MRVRCRRKESSRSLSRLLMSFLSLNVLVSYEVIYVHQNFRSRYLLRPLTQHHFDWNIYAGTAQYITRLTKDPRRQTKRRCEIAVGPLAERPTECWPTAPLTGTGARLGRRPAREM